MKNNSDHIYECPAFVDTHSHDDLAILDDPDRLCKKNQGIGAQVTGNCGICPFPALPESAESVRRLFDAVMGTHARRFDSVGDYRRHIRRDDIFPLQGYNALRASLFGPEPRRLDSGERKRAALAVARSISDGAAGLSLGLAYLPTLGADPEELIEIARETPLLTIHLRNESSAVIESVDEAAEIARKARCHLHISHLKISGRQFWFKRERLIQKIHQLHDEIGLTFDQYPYPYGCTGLAALLPPEISALPGNELLHVRPEGFAARYHDSNWENYVLMCGWDGLKLVSLVSHPEYNGCSISQVTDNPVELVLRLVQEELHPSILIRSQDDSLVDELLRLPFGCIGTDGMPPVPEHPRLTSSFPEFLKRCRVIGLTPQDAIQKAAVLPRKIFRISETIGGSIRFNWSTGDLM